MLVCTSCTGLSTAFRDSNIWTMLHVGNANLRWSLALQCCLLTHLINSQATSRILQSVPKLCMQHVLLLLPYIIADVYGSLDVKQNWFHENVMLTPHFLLCLPAAVVYSPADVYNMQSWCKSCWQVNNSGLCLVSEHSFYLWLLWSGMVVWLLFLDYGIEEKQTLSLAFHGLTS